MDLLKMLPNPGDVSPEETKENFAELEAILGKYFDKIAHNNQVERSNLALHVLSHFDAKGTQHLRYFVLHQNIYKWLDGKNGEKVALQTSFGKIIGNPIVELLDGQINSLAINMLNDFAKRNDLDPTKLYLHVSAGNLSKYVMYERKEYMKIDMENAINQYQQIAPNPARAEAMSTEILPLLSEAEGCGEMSVGQRGQNGSEQN